MGIDIVLSGTYSAGRFGRPRPRDWLVKAGTWWSSRDRELVSVRVGRDQKNASMTVLLHPAVEPLVLEANEQGRLTVTARTSGGGAGYHRRVCSDLHALAGDLRVSWDDAGSGDETGYFVTQNAAAVDRAMLDWLRAVITAILEVVRSDGSGASLVMPMSFSPTAPLADVYTQLGPRDLAWMEGAATDPSRGLDVMPWWTDEIDAAHYLKRALVTLWMEVQWRAPVTAEEGAVLLRAHNWLERAYELSGGDLDIPWREWSELDQLVPEEDLSRVRASEQLRATIRQRGDQLPSRPAIGYLRSDIIRRLDLGWSIRIPGAFGESIDKDGSWEAYDGDRYVRISTFTIANQGIPVPAAELLARTTVPDGDVLEPGSGDLVGAGAFTTAKGRAESRVFHGALAIDGQLLAVTIVFGTDEAWARQTWQSIAPTLVPPTSFLAVP